MTEAKDAAVAPAVAGVPVEQPQQRQGAPPVATAAVPALKLPTTMQQSQQAAKPQSQQQPKRKKSAGGISNLERTRCVLYSECMMLRHVG